MNGLHRINTHHIRSLDISKKKVDSFVFIGIHTLPNGLLYTVRALKLLIYESTFIIFHINIFYYWNIYT